MSVQKDPSGRRFVQIEVEVPGTPEEVWKAIATGPGVSSWFVPTKLEFDDAGKPVRVLSNFGPGMESVANITEWQPPNRFAAGSADLGPDAPNVATEWIVEAREGGKCVVRVVHSLFADSGDWDNQLEGWEGGWPGFFRLLRMYLTHFPGQESAAFQLGGVAPEPKEAAWTKLTSALGIAGAAVGDQVRASADCPPLAGLVERAGDAGYPEELLLRLKDPAPGIAHLFGMSMGGQIYLSIRFYLYGNGAAAAVARDEPMWQAWMQERFPIGAGGQPAC